MIYLLRCDSSESDISLSQETSSTKIYLGLNTLLLYLLLNICDMQYCTFTTLGSVSCTRILGHADLSSQRSNHQPFN